METVYALLLTGQLVLAPGSRFSITVVEAFRGAQAMERCRASYAARPGYGCARSTEVGTALGSVFGGGR